MYTYRVIYRGGVQIRTSPSLDSDVTDEILEYDEAFEASKSVSLDGTIYVKLKDGRGWVFERRGSTDILELVEFPKGHQPLQLWQLEVSTSAPKRDDLTMRERACLRQLGALLDVPRVDFARFVETCWTVAKLDDDRVIDMVLAQARRRDLGEAERRDAELIFEALAPKFQRLVAPLALRADHKLKDFLYGWIMLHYVVAEKTHLDTPPQKPSFFTSTLRALFCDGQQCLNNPDLQFALTF